MSHFVSKGANFDDLHARLLQRYTDTSEQASDVEAMEQALQEAEAETDDATAQPNAGPSIGGDDGQTPAVGSEASARPLASRSSSPRKPAATSGTASTSHTPFARSRKNSEDNLPVPGAPSAGQRRVSDKRNRTRKLSDPHVPSRPASAASPLRPGLDRSAPQSPLPGNGATARETDRISQYSVLGMQQPRPQRNVKFENMPSPGRSEPNGSMDEGYRSEYLSPGQMSPMERSSHENAHARPSDHHAHPHVHFNQTDQDDANVATPVRKLGTWDGVFMPVSLNILGIILFLRFGFILGQVGLLGALLLLTASYTIDALTAMSVSAISTNGQVRGGGAYYLISRSLGPEFGGSIGLVFFLGQALNASMNVLGFVESLTDAFGESRDGFLPEGPWWSFSYGSVVLLLSTIVCLVGSRLFAKATLALAIVLALAILSIPISSLFVRPFINIERGAYYTGWSLHTLRENLFPHFTSGAAGSSTGPFKENWQTVFGVIFPAVTGLLAGVSMSGDLRKPSKSIPKGTNWSLAFTYGTYVTAFFVFAATISRQSFYLDVGIVSDVALSPQLITFGVLAATGFSALMGVMACGKVLQAISRDELLPILDTFAQGTDSADTPVYAICATWAFCQCIILIDSVNVIAQFVTMTSLLTFGTLSFATLALKAGGAPSFRPSFQYWNIYTASAGTVATFGAMFFTAPLAASACIVFAIFLFSAIHFFCPPKPWGDVTRNLNYHIVRKYLLRLDERKSRVTHWRPQILLLANNPRTDWNVIIFCNSLKKGALYVLGHVLKGEFEECLGELRRQHIAWLKLVDVTGIKSFVDVIIAKDEREGARNLILSCGLGGMRPNIVCMGFPSHLPKAPVGKATNTNSKSHDSEITIKADEELAEQSHQVINVRMLPTDIARRETPILPSTYVGIMEDTLALQKGLAIAYGFERMSLSGPSTQYRGKSSAEEGGSVFIDLWPIQIQSPDADASHAWDTYTMVLQLGTILSMTGSWKHHKLRVSVFVEQEDEVEEERLRVRSLLDNLRIPATLRVFALSSEQVSTYQCIVRGKEPVSDAIKRELAGDPWWEALKKLREEQDKRREEMKAVSESAKKRSQAASPSGSSNLKIQKTESRKQNKREQRMLGVAMPKEHMEFFKRNMRIGLAHPRANKHARRQSESQAGNRPFGINISNDDSESEYSGSDSDDESDLSDELAQLDLDDLDWMSSSAGSNMRRRKTLGSYRRHNNDLRRRKSEQPRWARRSATFHTEEADSSARSPLFGRRNSDATDGSYGSLSSTPRPSMLAQGRQTAEPTIAESSSRGGDGLDSEGNNDTLRPQDRAEAKRRLQWQHHELLHGTSDSELDVSNTRQSIATTDEGSSSVDAEEGVAWRDGGRFGKAIPTLALGASEETPLVSFNLLPNKAQYLILNELIRINSSESTSIVVTSLPAPEAGTSQDAQRSLRYLQQLENLFGGGPPVLGVHAKQLTMTSAL